MSFLFQLSDDYSTLAVQIELELQKLHKHQSSDDFPFSYSSFFSQKNTPNKTIFLSQMISKKEMIILGLINHRFK